MAEDRRGSSCLVMKTSRPSSSIVSPTSPLSRPSSGESSRGTLTTPLPEVTLVAEKLTRSRSRSPLSQSSTKYRVNYGYSETSQPDDPSVSKLKRNIRWRWLRQFKFKLKLSFGVCLERATAFPQNLLMIYF